MVNWLQITSKVRDYSYWKLIKQQLLIIADRIKYSIFGLVLGCWIKWFCRRLSDGHPHKDLPRLRPEWQVIGVNRPKSRLVATSSLVTVSPPLQFVVVSRRVFKLTEYFNEKTLMEIGLKMENDQWSLISDLDINKEHFLFRPVSTVGKSGLTSC